MTVVVILGKANGKKVDFNTIHALRAKLSKSCLEANTDDFFGDR